MLWGGASVDRICLSEKSSLGAKLDWDVGSLNTGLEVLNSLPAGWAVMHWAFLYLSS